MSIFRIHKQGEVVGCIVAKNKSVAGAYALGKYGAGADAVKVAYKEAVELFGVCVLVATYEAENKQGVRIEA